MMIHRYWEGPVREETCDSRLWTPFKVRDWTFEDLPQELQEFLQYVPEGDAARHRANIVRYWLLANNDGMWVDHDVFPLNRSFVVMHFPENAWVSSMNGEPCGCMLGGDRRVWEKVFEYACASPIGNAAWNTSGKLVLKEFVDNGLIQLQSGLLSADTRGAPFKHLWLTSNERGRNGRSVSHGL